MDIFKIDNKIYKVKILEIEESFRIEQGENFGNTIADGLPSVLDPKGTFYSHKVTVKRDNTDYADFDNLYNAVSFPRYEGIPVEMVHNQTTIKYMARVEVGARKTNHIDLKRGKVRWDEMTIEFIPMKAQVLPI